MKNAKPIQTPQFASSHVWQHRRLIFTLAKREVSARFRGSILGVFWALLLPLTMLAIYSLVFGVIFKARWGVETGAKGEFAIILFTGLLLHALLADLITRSPLLMVHNANFVKKVVFPLEILPVVALLSGLFQFCVGFAVLLVGAVLVYGTLPLTLLFAPLIVWPFACIVLGGCWFLAAVGVYFRDIAQVMGVAATLLLFFSTVFYPAEHLPAALQPLIYLNPISFAADQLRLVTLQGAWPDWNGLALYYAAAFFALAFGFAVFQRARKGFADVL
jgi:lipopolysaccharide transport system permease protein